MQGSEEIKSEWRLVIDVYRAMEVHGKNRTEVGNTGWGDLSEADVLIRYASCLKNRSKLKGLPNNKKINLIRYILGTYQC